MSVPNSKPRRAVSADRVDGRAKVTGGAAYGADRSPDRLAHGYMIVSTVANATIRSMDVSAAERAPGVLAVYTPFNPLPLKPSGFLGPVRVPLADKEVVHHGQPIGFVVAETYEQARAAAMLVSADYDERPAAVSLEAGLPGAKEPDSVDGGPAVVTVLADGVGSIDEALRAAEVTVAATYTTAQQQHTPMEPHSAVTAWSGGRLTVHSSSQGAGVLASDLATALEVERGDVRALGPYVGGAFGGKYATYAQTRLAAAAARKLGRPVKTVNTREQVFTATATRAATRQEVTLGARRDGMLTAVRHDAWSGAAIGSATVEAGGHHSSLTWYASPNIQVGAKYVPLNVPEATIMRAPGEAPGSFALECAMDELAGELGIDPLELRIRNHATTDPHSGKPWSSKHLLECYRTGAERFGWSRRAKEPGSTADGDWLTGTGMATAVFPALRFPATMKVRFQADGTAAVSGSTADLGTGMWTVLSVVGSRALGLPAHRIKPALGDSALSDAGFVGGSAGTASVGSAILAAAGEAQKALIKLAVEHERSPFHGLDPDSVRYENGRLTADGGPSEDFDTVLAATGRPGVEAEGSSAPDQSQDYAYASFGAQFCEVRVNRWTSEIRVSRMLAVMDGGTVVNEKTARSQILGGMVWGLSSALHEGLHFDSAGRPANADLAGYLIPVNADTPAVDVHFLDHPDTRFNALGARGLGEIGIVGVAAAVANAVHHATGKRIRDLPITLDQLLE
ncbi:xanthine dehydrogenase family protein molybdopterin-binding subunit [Streptomyces sp. Ru87]|uniref:xanthine dehydrogenase family protein molybdopterin-binding subunit n=3 Tax=unclassified Streptomyces TaxID=2593676 RepID=UPI001C552AD8|nr:xanthine dehydrogenase family protein molybdopterin-binding subunit [Streptomyces sp. Ru87]